MTSRGPLSGCMFRTFKAPGGFAAGSYLSGAQTEQEYTDSFTEQTIDRLPIFNFNFVSQRRKAALRSDHCVENRLHRQVGIQVRPQRTIRDTVANEDAEVAKSLWVDSPL